MKNQSTRSVSHLFALAAVLLAPSSVSWADTYTSKPGGGAWNSGSTWVENAVPGASDDANITSAVNVGAVVNIHNVTITGSGTFFNGAAVNIGGDLILSATSKVQQGAAITISGNLTLDAGTQYDPSCNPMTVGGATSISGILKDGCGGANVNGLNGDVTVNAGGTWQLTDVTEWSVGGNLVNNGSITATSGGITFTGSGKTISGGATGIPKLTVNGTVQNDTTITVSSALAGGGTLTQGASSSLTVNGTVTLGALVATANPNTVTYSGAGNQNIVPGSYHQLVLGGGGVKTFAGDVAVAAALSIPAGPTRVNVNATLTAPGGVTVDSGATLGGTGAVNGLATVNGTLSPGLTATGLGTLALGVGPTLNNITTMDINRASGPNADLVSVAGTLSYGGTLTVVNRGATLQLGDTFQLFSAGGYGGGFGTVNLPTLGVNLGWNNTLLANGTITVVSTAAPGAPVLFITNDAGQLVLSWDSGTFPGYSLQSQSSASGIVGGGWGGVSGGDVSPYQTTLNPADPPTFYRLIKP